MNQEKNGDVHERLGSMGYISRSRLLILRSSVRAAIAVTCPLPPRMLFEKFSMALGCARSCWNAVSITCIHGNQDNVILMS